MRVRYDVKSGQGNSWEVWQTILDGNYLIESQSIIVCLTKDKAYTLARAIAEAYVIGPDGESDSDGPQYQTLPAWNNR